MSQMLNIGQYDTKRVDAFFGDFMKLTGHWFIRLQKRTDELDKRISSVSLSLADKIAVFKRLAPSAADSRLGAITDERKELRMARLLLSVAPEDLPLFKFALEYDGDYKDLEEYIFHDIDKKKYQAHIIEHFKKIPQQIGIKVLSDVDDTMYPNLIDKRYPKGKKTYPGVLEFYDSLKHEPFKLGAIPVTTLSARPSPIAGKLEEKSLESLVDLTNKRLCPSVLSGDLVSSAAGTIQTFSRVILKSIFPRLYARSSTAKTIRNWTRENLDLLSDEIPHGQEDRIGRVKFENFLRFSAVYPEYRYVFVGDSGQADALTAELMVKGSTEGTSRVVTTFIHDLRQSDDDEKLASSTFRNLSPDVLIGKTSTTGRGIIVFRNYIDAAIVAYMHSATLKNLVTAEGLAKITKAALKEFQEINFRDKEASRIRLREQYRQDAEEAYKLLKMSLPRSSPLEEDMQEIRRMLDEGFK